jgi:AraC-like DNA-binding protein
LNKIVNGTHEIVDYFGEFKIQIQQNIKNDDYPQHWHADTEIIMPIENPYMVIINETTYNLEAEDIIIIPSGELHKCYAPPSGCRIVLLFDSTMFYSMNGFNSVFHMFHPCVVVTPSLMPDIHKVLSSLIQDITSEYFSTLPLKEASIYSMLIRFFTIMGRNCINGSDRFPNIKNRKQLEYIDLFLNVCNYINEHCTENIKMDDVANIAGFSKFHFERLFKQFMNVSCYEYLINRRIMQAEKLLTEPELSIMQVAMKSGFSSLATFNRLFKAKKRCNPTEYKSLYGIY